MKVQPHNQLLLDFIKRNQPISFVELFRNFDGAGNESVAFSARLNYLKAQGHLTCTGRANDSSWSVNPETAPETAASVKRPEKPKPAPEEPAPVKAVPTPPAQYDIMRAPVWRTPAMPAGRAGAQDFAACPSIHQGRALPYKPPSSEVHCG